MKPSARKRKEGIEKMRRLGKKIRRRYNYVPALPSACNFHFNERELRQIRESMITCRKTGPDNTLADIWGASRRHHYIWLSDYKGVSFF
jgi:hypothetical protein